MMRWKVFESLILKIKNHFKEEIEAFSVSPAFLALNEEEFERINEEVETVENDAFIKDIHSLGFWYLDSLGAYLPQNMISYVTYEALDELEEAYIFDAKRLDQDKFLTLPKIPNSTKYQMIETCEYQRVF